MRGLDDANEFKGGGLWKYPKRPIYPADMNYPVLADTARYYKEDKEGISTMCKAMEDMITDEKKEIALRLIETGKLSLDEIANCSNLSLEEVQKLADEELQPV